MIEITEQEAKVLEDYADKITLFKDGTLSANLISLNVGLQAYHAALCVKYNQDPLKVIINFKERRFEPR